MYVCAGTSALSLFLRLVHWMYTSSWLSFMQASEVTLIRIILLLCKIFLILVIPMTVCYVGDF